MDITYIERTTGQKRIEKVYGAKHLLRLYGEDNWFFSTLILPLMAYIPFFSWLYGWLQKRKASAKKIAPFIDLYDVNAQEFQTQKFASFNDFFIRKLKPECRPIDPDPHTLTMPADGRYLVYPTFSQFTVKGKQFDLTRFLQNPSHAHRFAEGSMAIIRLCPSDYHRFHFPCDALASAPCLINGPLFSVNPLALAKRISIFAENKRAITELETERFGTLLYIEVGATFVGSIRQTYAPNSPVKKGQEKGYFEFGGSCIVLFAEKGQITWDPDLIANTQQGFETLGRYGESLGKSIRC